MPSLTDPVAVSFLGLEIRWYALFILTGVLCAMVVLRWLARQRELNPDFPLDAIPWIVLPALLGARLYYLALDPDFYLATRIRRSMPDWAG